MTESRPGPIYRFFRGLWRTLDFSRRLVMNIIFLLIVIFVLALLSREAPRLTGESTLVLDPQGMVVEQFTGDAAERALAKAMGQEAQETQLRDLLQVLERAASDDRVQRLLIRPDHLSGIGFEHLRELGRAIQRFKQSGKPVIAYADNLDQRQYYLAAFADKVYLNPAGGLFLEGLSSYRTYYREALQDKLGVKVHLFRVGEYKSAAEPYILDGPSPEASEATLFWMGDIWGRYLDDIASARGIEAQAIQDGIDHMAERLDQADGNLAQLALDAGLVDDLKTAEELRELMLADGAPRDGDELRRVDSTTYLGFIQAEVLPFDTRPKVAVVVAQGEIRGGKQPRGMVGGVTTSALIKQAREDDAVKAVVLRVDSPGGEVFASEQIRHQVELTRAAGKPVVVSMANVAASGGYWISMNADRIIADESTITGSIGIFGLFFTGQETLGGIGVHTGGVGTTAMAGALDPRRDIPAQAAAVVQRIIDRGYRDFIGKVAAARDTTPEAIDEVARGRVWSGAQAMERGLIDQFGGLREALTEAATLAGIEGEHGYRTEYVEKPLSPFEQFAQNLGSNARVASMMAHLGVAPLLLGEQGTAQFQQDLALLQPPKGQPFRSLAHCFCMP
ncbi:MAG: signal peptide peptidase SppA [Xanthomonadales bacterium]|nr:signal peptide peptidase SppA [Xanthomonadales bacterium]